MTEELPPRLRGLQQQILDQQSVRIEQQSAKRPSPSTWPVLKLPLLLSTVMLVGGLGLGVALLAFETGSAEAVGLMFVGLFALGIGVVLVGVTVEDRARGARRTGKTIALVTHATLASNLSDDGHVSKHVVLTVRFEANGEQVTAQADLFGLGSHNVDSAHKRTLERYAPGTTVDVFYDPEEPTNAGLSRSPRSGVYYVGVVLLAVGALTAGALRLKSKRERSRARGRA